MSSIKSRLGDYLFDKALAAECKRSGLASTSIKLSFGSIEYLQSTDMSANSPEAIVMLHGAASDKNSWVRFARYLHPRLPMLIPDLPGHGESIADMSLDYSIHAQSVRVKEFMTALGLSRVRLIGNSMGGAIALHLAANYPDLISSLILIDAAGVEVTPSWLRQHVTETGKHPMLEIRDVKDYRAMMRIGMEAPPYIPGFMISVLTRDFVRRNAINHKIARDIEQDLDQSANLSSISARSLIIWGAADKVLHLDNAEFLHQRLANSEKIVLAGIGHVPMVEAPKQVAAACKAFFEDVSSSHPTAYTSL